MMTKLFAVALFCTVLLSVPPSASANFLPFRNERFVIRALQTLVGAQVTYAATTNSGYGSLDNLAQAQLIAPSLASGEIYGYRFVVQTINGTPNVPASYTITATPRRYRKTGRRSFYIDETGVLRGADKNGVSANVSDPIVEDDCLPTEECAISDLRTLIGAQATFNAISNDGNYGSLNQLHAVGLISERLKNGLLHGYAVVCSTVPLTNSAPAAYKITAVPINYGVTGIRSFYVDENGVIRGADKNGAPANADDPPIQQ